MIQKILGFLKGLFSEENVKSSRERIEKIESFLDPVITKEEETTEKVETPKTTKKPKKQTAKKSKKKED